MKNKIIATLGPTSLNERTVNQMDLFGVDYFRINLSHTKVEEFEPLVEQLRKWTNKEICPDTEGSQLRNGIVKENHHELLMHDEIYLIGCNNSKNQEALLLNIPNPGEILQVGDVLNIDFDGAMIQINDIIDKSTVIARVLKSGVVGSNKGIGLDRVIIMPSFSKKDKQIIKIANRLSLKTIFLSFCSNGADVKKLRSMFNYNVEIISKIESRSAILHLTEICHESDAILIDRGDLSRDVQLEKIAHIQDYILNLANDINTPVFVATNLMESMLHKSQPTRAEINDIVGALNSGANGLVLAAETAIGKYPADAVRILSQIIHENNDNDNTTDPEKFFQFTSPLLNAPHGGKLVQQYHNKEFVDNTYPNLFVDDKTITDIIQICEGTYSPINNFMNIDEIKSVLDNYELHNGNPWTLPIIFQVNSDDIANLPQSGTISIKSKKNNLTIAIVEIEKIEHIEKIKSYIKKWFGTEDNKHPGMVDLYSRGDYILSGKPYLIRENISTFKTKYELSPNQTRSLFHQYGWHKIVGFHTRNVPHRGHQYIQKMALDQVGADCLFISPVIGLKKKGDFLSDIIMDCYKTLIKNDVYKPYPAIIGGFNTYSRYSGPREAVFTAICRKNYGCSHFIIGRDHTGISNYYSPDESQKIFDKLEIGINLVPFKEIVYDKNNNEYTEFCSDDNNVNICKLSGTLVRDIISNNLPNNGYLIDDKIYKYLKEQKASNRKIFIH